MFIKDKATSAILMRMMKMGGGQQLARSRYLLRWSSGSIHLETDCWNLSKHPNFLSPSVRSCPLWTCLSPRSTSKCSCSSRSMASIIASVLHSKGDQKYHTPHLGYALLEGSYVYVQLQLCHLNNSYYETLITVLVI